MNEWINEWPAFLLRAASRSGYLYTIATLRNLTKQSSGVLVIKRMEMTQVSTDKT